MDLLTGHPHFLARFTDPLYSDVSGEFAPFGTDEGADILAEWSNRTDELSGGTTLRQLLDDGADQPASSVMDEVATAGPDGDSIIIGAGFTLLRLTGHIDTEGHQFLLDALDRSSTFYTPAAAPEFDQMIQDLNRAGHQPSQPAATSETSQTPASELLPPARRHAWLSIHAHREEDRTLRLPNAYRQHLSWLSAQLNQDIDWWAWWDRGRGHESVLSGYIDWVSMPTRKPKLTARMSAGIEVVTVTLQVPTDGVSSSDANELGRFSLSHVLLARQHVEQLLASVSSKYALTAPHSLPQTKREGHSHVV